MEMLDRLRRLLPMSARMTTLEELVERLAEVDEKILEARADLEAEEDAIAATGVSGRVDEVSIARVEKRRSAKRERLTNLLEHRKRLQANVQVKTEHDLAERLAADIAVIEGELGQVEVVDRELDAALAQVAGLLKRRQGRVNAVLGKFAELSNRGDLLTRPDLPPMLAGHMPKFLNLRLFALAGSLVTPPGAVSEWDAQRLPSLAERSAAERRYVMGQLRPAPTGPRAA